MNDRDVINDILADDWLDIPIFLRDKVNARADRLLARAEAAEARVAELEAQLAAQGWRPVTEKPTEPPDGETSEYLTWNDFVGFTVRRYRDGQFHSAFRKQPTHWRPLPPAPQEPTQ